MKEKLRPGFCDINYDEISTTVKTLNVKGVSFEDLSLLYLNKDLVKEVSAIIKANSMVFNYDVLAVWKDIYKEWFWMDLDFSRVEIPAIYNPKKHFLLVVASGITCKKLVEEMSKRFGVYLQSKNLDAPAINNVRDPKDGAYIILFDRKTEAKEPSGGVLVGKLKEGKREKITLLERLLLEVFYYNETERHLDLSSQTLCTGSQHESNGTPSVYWSPTYKELWIHSSTPNYSNNSARSRSVVFWKKIS